MQKYALVSGRIGLAAITNLLVAVSALVLLAIVTKTLSVADYGTWALFLVTLSLVPKLVTLGLPFTMVRFIAASKDKQETREIFYSLTFVSLFASFITCVLLFAFERQIAAGLFHNDITSTHLFVVSIFVACLNTTLLNYFRARQQIRKHSVLTLVQSYLSVAIVAYFILSGFGLQGALAGYLIQQILVFLLMSYLILTEIGITIPKFVNVREHLAFGLPLVPGSLSAWIVSSSDRYLIGLFLGTVAVGYYSPGYSLGSNLSLISAPLTLMLPAALSQHYDENQVDAVKAIMKYSLKYYCGIAIPIAFVISVLSRPILTILTTKEIAANGYFITPFVAAATLLVGAYEVFVLTNTLKKKTAITGMIWTISAGLNIGLNLIIIPYLGIIGAALTTLLAFACAFVLTTVYSLQQFTFDINARFVLKSIFASIMVSVLLLLRPPVGLMSILVSILIAAAFYLGILFILRGFTIQELKFFYSMFRGALNRVRSM